MENNSFEKSVPFILADTLDYVPNSVLIKTLFRKITGNISAFSFDTGEVLTEKITPFDIFIQVIDGRAEIILNGESNVVETGESIIIPAHCRTIIKANTRFKMLSTLIKSGYDEVS
ncbi:MAG: cupin domain-containing protein [Sediminibacterium sp.]